MKGEFEMYAGILLAIFWATVYLGHKIEEMKQDQIKIYKDLSKGICYLIDETDKRTN